VLLPLAVFLGMAVVQGWRLQVIETGSMAPRYPAGSLAVVEPVEGAEVRPGMTVVFEDPLIRGRLVAHRIVKRLPSTSVMWATKGDANAEGDPAPVAATAIQGRVRWAVPGVGRAVSALHDGGAVGLLVGAPLTILLFTEIAALRRRRREPTAGATP
jgi:signal peptidase